MALHQDKLDIKPLSNCSILAMNKNVVSYFIIESNNLMRRW
jgi:hypothetical protein